MFEQFEQIENGQILTPFRVFFDNYFADKYLFYNILYLHTYVFVLKVDISIISFLSNFQLL